MWRGAKIVAEMNERCRFGDRLQIENPIEGAVPAASHHDVSIAEALHLPHGLVHRVAFKRLDTLDLRLARYERTAAGGDH